MPAYSNRMILDGKLQMLIEKTLQLITEAMKELATLNDSVRTADLGQYITKTLTNYDQCPVILQLSTKFRTIN
jgi:hypothetical protein